MTLISTNVKSEELRNLVLHIFDQLGEAAIITEDLMLVLSQILKKYITYMLTLLKDTTNVLLLLHMLNAGLTFR